MNEPSNMVRVGLHALNLHAVASAHFEGPTLYVHLVGGRFLSFKGEDAQHVWRAIVLPAVDLRTGEVPA